MEQEAVGRSCLVNVVYVFGGWHRRALPGCPKTREKESSSRTGFFCGSLIETSVGSAYGTRGSDAATRLTARTSYYVAIFAALLAALAHRY